MRFDFHHQWIKPWQWRQYKWIDFSIIHASFEIGNSEFPSCILLVIIGLGLEVSWHNK